MHVPRQLHRRALLLVGAALLLPRHARANPFEETFGAGTRAKGMAGAGVVLVDDYAAVYYNPAGLTGCRGGAAAVSYDRIDYNLTIQDEEFFPFVEQMPSYNAVTVGACVALPARAHMGLLLSQGIRTPGFIDQTTPDETPLFVMYGQRIESLSIMLGGSIELVDGLSVGFTFLQLANSKLFTGNDIPILDDTQVTSNSYRWKMARSSAYHVGLRYAVSDDLAFGLVYRSSLAHRLRATAETSVRLAGDRPLPTELTLRSISWYTPHQVAAGASYRLTGQLVLAGDLTWYDWSAYPGPFIRVSVEEGSTTDELVNPPDPVKARFEDVVIPRIGLEWGASPWTLRGGYSYHFSPAPKPSGRTNVLDADTHVLSAGGRFSLTLGDEASTGSASDQPSTGLAIEAHASVGIMPMQTVQKREEQEILTDYTFGGQIFSVGVSSTLTF